jgi:hypothetical protein
MSSVRDILIIAILLFVSGITIFFTVDIGHKVNVQLLTTPTFNDSANAQTVIASSDAAINKVDYIYLALFIGFFISIIVTGWFVGGVPIAAPIYFFVITIFGFVAVILQQAWRDISANAQTIATTTALPITHFILSNLGYFTVVIGLVGIAAMFAKPAGQGGY